jgi:hypothetical protein
MNTQAKSTSASDLVEHSFPRCHVRDPKELQTIKMNTRGHWLLYLAGCFDLSQGLSKIG